jgi:tetratricopeptide (TPR) repeat protein/outer membrane protein OmpA-like peptidoglycan-associated protein
MKRASIVALLLAFFGIYAVEAQVILAQQYETKADYAFELRDYNTALSHYMTILKDEPQRADLYWKTAEAARLTRHYAAAEKYYEALANTDEGKKQPLLDYKLGLVKKSRGKYDEAIARFQKYLDANASGEMASIAMTEIETSKWASIESKKNVYEVSHLNENINSTFIDAAPVQIGSILYFSSAYQATPADKPVTHVFATNFQEKALPLSINSNEDGVHTAHYTVASEGGRLFYTLSTVNESGDFDTQIWTRSKDADGTWGFARIVDSLINLKGYTNTQPNVGFDKTRNKDVLYFVSNRPGGKGGLDIWFAELEKDGRLGTPQNLAAVNTAKDDVTPFFMSEQQILLFSTEGGKTLGGFDIFRMKKDGANWSSAENLGSPINSGYDDLYPSFSPDAGRYFFVSNREGGLCGSKEKDCVCNDIYMQEIKAKLNASSLYASSGTPLNGCRFDLLDANTGQVIKYDVNMSGNSFAYPLDLNRRYLIVASKKGFLPDTVSFDTKGLHEPITTLNKELKLRPNIKLEVLVFDKVTRKKLDGATVTIATMDGKVLKTEVLKGNQLWWDEPEFNTTYRITATKATYDKDEKTIVTEGYATMTKSEYRTELYLAPFSGLPLTLYFHNDEPDAKSREMTTAKSYGETFLGYYNLQSDYLAASDRTSDDDNNNFADSISSFFDNRLKFGYEKLQQFSPLLSNYLSAGYGMELVIRGFASPLAENEYNRILTSRRVSSVINHFYKYQNGLFRDFITKGQLRIRVEPNGEDQTTFNASDDYKNKKKSIYSLSAMKERRVEIQEVSRFEFNPGESFNLNESLGIYFDYTNLGIAKPKLGNARARVRMANDDELIAVKATSKRTKKGKKAAVAEVNADGGYGVTYGVSSSSTYADGSTVGSRNSSYSESSNSSSSSNLGMSGGSTSESMQLTSKSVDIKQKYEVVFVDSYTGEIVTGLAEVELYNNADQVIGKAVRTKGKNGFIYSVDFNQNYSVKGGVAGYSTETRSHFATNTGGMVTDTIYLTPFAGLPLSLYFDNDRPTAGATTEESASTYDQAYQDFAARKSEFIRTYNKMTASAAGSSVSNNEMSLFFGAEVKGGFDRLKGFSNILEGYMSRGYQIEITIEGFASPLANMDYNQKLAARRVDAVINHFESVNGGFLRKYIKNGHLKITVSPTGEVSNQVSDDIKNTSSIYSIEASRERRVVIKDIVILNRF